MCVMHRDDLERAEIDNESRFPAENSEVTFKLNIAQANSKKGERERGRSLKRESEREKERRKDFGKKSAFLSIRVQQSFLRQSVLHQSMKYERRVWSGKAPLTF